MTDTMQDLAKRAVASPHWRWMPGMLARYENGGWYRVTEADGVGMPVSYRPQDPRYAFPDLDDPATLGCLLQLVREAHDWFVGGYARGLVAALEAAQ